MPANVATPEIRHRTYGKRDFERFDNISAQQASIASQAIGKVKVNCKFLFTKSQWGVLTPQENPAGVIYLNLSFEQPDGSRLKNATVTVTLDEENDDLRSIPTTLRRDPVPVMIDTYGPHHIQGEAQRVHKINRTIVKPQLQVMGAGGGGLGFESEKASVQESRWHLASNLSADPHSKRHAWACRVITWELAENQLAKQPDHSNTFHAAFSFQHDGQPFFMQVKVAGSLESRRSEQKRKIKEKWKEWSFPSDPREAPAATTLINFGGRNLARFNRPLDELSRDLPLAMEQENMYAVPTQLPTAQTPAFLEGIVEGDVWDVDTIPPGARSPRIRRENSTARRRLEHASSRPRRQLPERPLAMPGHFLNEEPFTVNETPRNISSVDRTLPTEENLASAASFLTQPRNLQVRRPLKQTRASRYHSSFQPDTVQYSPENRQASEARSSLFRSSETSSMTYVEQEADGAGEGASRAHVARTTQDHIDPETIRLVFSSGLLKVVQLLVIMFSAFGLDVGALVRKSGVSGDVLLDGDLYEKQEFRRRRVATA